MKITVETSGSHFLTWLAMLALAASPAAQALLAVDNVRAERRADSKLVDIDFDVTGTTTPVTVSLEISADGGTTWAVPATTLTDKDGIKFVSSVTPVTPGKDLRITWNAGTDWNNQMSTEMCFRITASDASDVNNFMPIPEGYFIMGDMLDNDTNAPAHMVNVSKFHMLKKEVSKSQWTEVRAWALKYKYPYTNLAAGAGKADTHPIEKITWYDVAKWCNAMSEKERLTPCYYTATPLTTDTVYRKGTSDAVVCDWTANGYRLPTEAEWEKAARGGLSGKRFPWGDTITHSQANYYVALASDGKTNLYKYDISPTSLWNPTYKTVLTPYTAPVGSFAANGYGLFDMAGNVREWCWDRYDAAYYATSPTTDPHGPDVGTNRMLRGGDWGATAISNRVAYRYSGGAPGTKSDRFGFRTVRSNVATATDESSNITVLTRSWVYLTTSTLSNGTITGIAAGGIYSWPGATATLKAKPDPGYEFTRWTGDATGAINPLILPMDADKTLGAIFTRVQYTLTIITPSNGSITGRVTSGEYPSGDYATLRAVPTAGYVFTEWTGDAAGITTNPLPLKMDSDKTLGATFTRQYTLNTSTLGNGTITVMPTGGKYLTGTPVTLTPSPNTGYVFTGWTGAVTGTQDPLKLVMNDDTSLVANFAKDLADSDGDGLTNFDELVILGTDPHSSGPPLMTLTRGTGTSFTLKFLARAASAGLTRKYDVQWSSTLAPGSWLGVPGPDKTNIVGDNTTKDIPLTIDAARKFYRLSVRVE